MKHFLLLASFIDNTNSHIGRATSWLILIAVLVSAGNAVMRYTIGDSSNARLELQWVLIAAVFLLCAGYTLLNQQHVKIDILYSRLPRRAQLWVDIWGTILFLWPMAFIIMWLSWPVFIAALSSGEVSANTGGLTLWWARLLVPVGFFFLILQGLSEIIKRVAILRGLIPDTSDSADSTAQAA